MYLHSPTPLSTAHVRMAPFCAMLSSVPFPSSERESIEHFVGVQLVIFAA